MIVPVLHQVYVWLAWRGELCFSAVTKILGPGGFRPYAVLFSIFMLLRILIFLGLAISDRGTVPLPAAATLPLAAAAAALSAYAFYSVARYFTFRRAFGIDHFDPAYRSAPLVREGIFRYTRNGMYTFAFLIFWAITLIFASRAALVASLFAHAYVWVHYLCTEKPDMEVIYGGAGSPG